MSLALVQPLLEGEVGGFVSWVVAVVSVALGVVIAFAVTPPLSGPALEQIVSLVERDVGAPERQPLGVLAEIWCGFRAFAFAAMIALPILFVLWLVKFFFPPASVVTIPCTFVVVSLSLAWNLFDYPLTLRGVRMRERLSLVRAHKRTCLGFGAAFSILFWVPGCGVILLPVGVAAATRLLWRILEADARVLPSLPRPQERSIAMPS